MNRINIRPTTSVLATYKRLSYSAWYAIAEFVDNSTASFYMNKKKLRKINDKYKLQISINYYSDKKKLVISDDAFGMDLEDFSRAIRLDSPPRDKSGRNEFGMGLKTAASWFGNKWKVETTQYGSDVKYSAVIDINEMVDHQPEEIEYTTEESTIYEHYTVITIWELHHELKGRTIGRIKSELESIYRRDIQSGDIEIEWRGEKLMYSNPVLRKSKDGNTFLKNFQFMIEDPLNNRVLPVKGWAGILEVGSRKNAGFTIFRRDRVIIGGINKNYRPKEIFGDSGSFVYQRIVGELDMDYWPVSHTKDAINWTGELEDNLINRLYDELEDLVIKAKNLRYRKTEEPVLDVLEKDHVEIKDDLNRKIIDLNNSELSLSIQENLDLNDRYIDDHISKEDLSLNDNSYDFSLNGFEYIVNWVDESDKYWLEITETEKDSKLTKNLIINIGHPYFVPFNADKNFIKFLNGLIVALVHSVDLTERSNQPISRLRVHMNRILKSLSKDE